MIWGRGNVANSILRHNWILVSRWHHPKLDLLVGHVSQILYGASGGVSGSRGYNRIHHHKELLSQEWACMVHVQSWLGNPMNAVVPGLVLFGFLGILNNSWLSSIASSIPGHHVMLLEKLFIIETSGWPSCSCCRTWSLKYHHTTSPQYTTVLDREFTPPSVEGFHLLLLSILPAL